MPSIKAYIDDFNLMTVSIPRSFFGGETFGFYVLNDKDDLIPCAVKERKEYEQLLVYTLTIENKFRVGERYALREFHGQTIPLEYRFITHKKEFNDLFAYDKEDLGSFYHGNYTDFAVWAPNASSVILKLYKD